MRVVSLLYCPTLLLVQNIILNLSLKLKCFICHFPILFDPIFLLYSFYSITIVSAEVGIYSNCIMHNSTYIIIEDGICVSKYFCEAII